MDKAARLEERRRDDAWTGPKLLILCVVTLSGALAAIYLIAARFTPAGYPPFP